jgi:hypothetical protein
MKPLSIFIATLCFTFTSFSQVHGKIGNDNRPVVKKINYTMKFAEKGKIVYKIVVDNSGKVTTCLEDEKQSTVHNTPMMKRGRDLILNHLKFEGGKKWPPKHDGYVTIKLV